MRICNRMNCLLVYIGSACLIIGITLSISWTYIFDYIWTNQMKLSPSSKSFDMWQKAPFPIYLDFYFFNWTNPEELMDPNVKPHFEEVGPYRFKEDKEKVNMKWNDNGTITYQQRRYWYFEPVDSKWSLNDTINTLNVVSATAAFQTRHWSYLMQKGISLSLSTIVNKVYVTRRIGELLFEGYEDIIIDMARNMPAFDGIEIPPLDRFGWFYGRNGSTTMDGIFTMDTGANGIDVLGRLQRWNNVTRTKYFNENCGDVTGSAGEFWPPDRTRDKISMFSSDMCRTMTFDYENDVDVLGINGYKYVGSDSIMDNGTLHPENKCFCNGDCIPSGAVNVSTCRFGAPAFVSFPHFYNADPSYRQTITGMLPEKSKHQFFITLEPTTGIPLEVAARLQINILLQPSEYIALYQDVPKIFIPVLWFEQHVIVNEELASPLKLLLNTPYYSFCMNITLISLGLMLLAIASGRKLYEALKDRRKDKMIQRWGNGGSHIPMVKQHMMKSNPNKDDLLMTTVYTE